MKLTHKVKLVTSPEQVKLLKTAMWAFNNACNYASKIAFESKELRTFSLHHLCYKYLRSEFGLPSQYAIRAIAVVADSYKVQKGHNKVQTSFRPRAAVVMDDRLYTHRADGMLSISTLDGRIVVPIQFAKRSAGISLKGQADLTYQNGAFYLAVTCEQSVPQTYTTDKWLGVDLGVCNIATASNGTCFSGKSIDKVRERSARLRKSLQGCGTRNSRRKLFRSGRKQSRFVRNINHCISKQIVSAAKALNCGIALEALCRIQKTVRKSQRQRLGQWSFYQLRSFIEYKAALAGVPIFLVDPRNTSRMCSQCGHCSKSNRQTQSLFVCEHCGYTANADFNAAVNIAARAAVNPPIAPHCGTPNYVPVRSEQAHPL